MLTRIPTSDVTTGTYIKFWKEPRNPKKKTDTYFVANNNDIPLGNISWFSRWRKYAFYPYSDMVFEEICLKEIAEFIQQETYNYKKEKSKACQHY